MNRQPGAKDILRTIVKGNAKPKGAFAQKKINDVIRVLMMDVIVKIKGRMGRKFA